MQTMQHQNIESLQSEDLLIDAVFCLAEPSKLEFLVHAGHTIRTIEFHDPDQSKNKVQPSENKVEGTLLDSEWYPFWGYSETGEVDYDSRYSLQYHTFYENKFKTFDTYEHDWYLNNYTGATYLEEGSTSPPGCWPLGIEYIATNYPSSSAPYWDTRLDQDGSCASSELPFTIGAGNAKDLPEKTWLYTYVVAKKGKSDRGSYKINAQKGHQVPIGCTSTWCSFGDEIARVHRAWDSDVPSHDDWECIPTRYVGGTCTS